MVKLLLRLRGLQIQVKLFTILVLGIDMTLDDYRKQNNWSYSELARQLGASHAAVARRWCLGFEDSARLIPNQEFMSNIMLKTNGAVMPNDFYVKR